MEALSPAHWAAAGAAVVLTAAIAKLVSWMRDVKEYKYVFPADVAKTAEAVCYPAYTLPASILITGGNGFLGRNIVEALLGQACVKKIVVFDIAVPSTPPPDARIVYAKGDLLDAPALRGLLKQHAVGAVIHTAAPHPFAHDKSLFERVNVRGTEAVVAACLAEGVQTLVATSSASVVWAGHPHAGVDESVPYPARFRDAYAETKARAEQIVLAAGKQHGGRLLALALRPHSIFGPKDRQMVPAVVEACRGGKDKFVMGDGANMVDWTYIGNVVHAHLLAVQAGARHWASAAGKAGQPAPASGRAYFITNGEPLPFWDFMNALMCGFGYEGAKLRLPAALMLPLAHVAEAVTGVVGALRGKPVDITFNVSRVQIITTVHWYSIAAAARDLGYAPLWSMPQALYLTLQSFATLRNPRPSRAAVARARACNLVQLGVVPDPYSSTKLGEDPATWPSFTAAQVAAHNSETDCWVIIEGCVYDLSKYVRQHPGGLRPILSNAGKDATKGFFGGQHPEHVHHTVKLFRIGKLAAE